MSTALMNYILLAAINYYKDISSKMLSAKDLGHYNKKIEIHRLKKAVHR